MREIFEHIGELGQQHRANGTETKFEFLRDQMRLLNNQKIREDVELTWAEVISDGYYQLMAETDNSKIKIYASQARCSVSDLGFGSKILGSWVLGLKTKASEQVEAEGDAHSASACFLFLLFSL